ncbi:hypothetical protein V2J09_015918 [Rumex salicifolius]
MPPAEPKVQHSMEELERKKKKEEKNPQANQILHRRMGQQRNKNSVTVKTGGHELSSLYKT